MINRSVIIDGLILLQDESVVSTILHSQACTKIKIHHSGFLRSDLNYILLLEKAICKFYFSSFHKKKKPDYFCYSVLGTAVIPPSPSGPYGIALEQLASMNRDHNLSAFQQYGEARLPFPFITFWLVL